MAQLPSQFNAGDHDKIGDFQPLPQGEYLMQVVKSEMVETKAKNGQYYLKLEFEVLDGEHSKRKVWSNLNLVNNNPVAVEIANKELATLCDAAGLPGITDSEELHGHPVIGVVRVTPETTQYPASNDIRTYKKAEAGGVQVSGGAVPTSDIPKVDPPWKTKK